MAPRRTRFSFSSDPSAPPPSAAFARQTITPPPPWLPLSKLVHLCNKPGEQERCRRVGGRPTSDPVAGARKAYCCLPSRARLTIVSGSRARERLAARAAFKPAALCLPVLAASARISRRRCLGFLDSPGSLSRRPDREQGGPRGKGASVREGQERRGGQAAASGDGTDSPSCWRRECACSDPAEALLGMGRPWQEIGRAHV